MHPMSMSLACFLSVIRPPGVEFENSYLQIVPIDKYKCPYVRDTNDIGFRLYTKHNPTVFQELYIGDERNLADSHINFKDPTVIFFHAFLESPDVGSAVLVREAYMLRGDTNVIMVDAQRLEAGPWYFTAAENTWFIGQMGARFVDYLVSRGLDLSKTHLIGHSLGAQAAGVAGSAIHSGRVARITGLDPAKPLFQHLPYSQKLDAGDAHFVDVIHTDAGIFGVHPPIGHADFFPNGGISPQPGCELEIVFPKQLVLEKCKTQTQTRPLNGLFFFELQTNKQTKLEKKSEIKLQKFYKYSKKERDTKQLKYEKNRKPLNLKTTEPITTEKTHTKKDLSQSEDMLISYQQRHPNIVKKRQKRFSLFRRPSEAELQDNFIHKMVEFLIKNRKNVIPVVSVMREINTLVKNGENQLSHVSKERNNYIGSAPPLVTPLNFNLELGKDPPVRAFFKRMLGLSTQTEKLSISGGGPVSSGLFGKK